MRFDQASGEILATQDDIFVGHGQQVVNLKSAAEVPLAPLEAARLLEKVAQDVTTFALGSHLNGTEREALRARLVTLQSGALALSEAVADAPVNPRVTPVVSA